MRSAFVLTAVVGLTTFQSSAAQDLRPNILLILADDLGYADVGSYGSEIATPSIDALANDGVQLLNYHSGPTCGPTRAMLMSGIDHHRAGVGTNAASLLRLTQLKGRPGYEGYLNNRVIAFPRLLQDAGYDTFMTGKWDLGKGPGQLPADRGFDRSFGLADGGASHFSDARGSFRPVSEATYFEDSQFIDTLPENFYSSEFYTSKMIEYLAERDNKDRPYFAYVAYTAVHWPLQVPDAWLDRYRGRYAEGWQVLREERLERQKALGIVPPDTELPPAANGYDDWTTLTPSRRVLEVRRMELYAAMIELLDAQIGRLVETVEADDSRETIVLFLSDNGPEGNDIGQVNDNEHWIPLTFDNRRENLGRRGSYQWLGAGWGLASATPFSLYKSFVSEGGIRTPAVAYSTHGRMPQAARDDLVTVMDIAPTILELAGARHPGENYHGRQVLPIAGRSAAAYLAGDADSVHSGQPIGWELYGNRALIVDDWKASLTWPPEGSGKWQLHDIGADPSETNNLADSNPEQLDDMIELWEGYAEQNGVYVLDRDVGYGRFKRSN